MKANKKSKYPRYEAWKKEKEKQEVKPSMKIKDAIGMIISGVIAFFFGSIAWNVLGVGWGIGTGLVIFFVGVGMWTTINNALDKINKP